MKFVVDTNIFVSFFRESPVREIILNSEKFNLELFSPEYMFDELDKNKNSLVKYSKSSVDGVDLSLKALRECINIISSDLFKSFEEKAKLLSPHDKDMPFFALALKLNCSIWSNEPAFKRQTFIKVFNTRELRELVNFD